MFLRNKYKAGKHYSTVCTFHAPHPSFWCCDGCRGERQEKNDGQERKPIQWLLVSRMPLTGGSLTCKGQIGGALKRKGVDCRRRLKLSRVAQRWLSPGGPAWWKCHLWGNHLQKDPAKHLWGQCGKGGGVMLCRINTPYMDLRTSPAGLGEKSMQATFLVSSAVSPSAFVELPIGNRIPVFLALYLLVLGDSLPLNLETLLS